MDFDKIIGVVAILLFFSIIGFYIFCVVRIPPDENAIIFRQYGGGIDKEKIFLPGRQIIAPWDHFITYNITTQKGFEKISRSSKDGFEYSIELNYYFRVKPNKLGFLHSEIGEDYHEIVIKPAIRDGVKGMLERYSSGDISALGNKRIESEIKIRSQADLEAKYLRLESVSIQEIIAPVKIPRMNSGK